MTIGMGQILLILLLVFVIFGAGKLPRVMAELAQGLKAFKQGMAEDDAKEAESRDKSKDA